MKSFTVISLHIILLALSLVLFNIAYGAETTSIDMKGVLNFHKLSDTLYRSEQPSAEGFANLKAMGIKTIINLRSFHSDRDEIERSGISYEHIFMKTWHPEEEDAVRFLQIVTNPKRTPVLVHCQHGADRTGIMCALYRVAVQGWKKEEAIHEMTQGGFGFHKIWNNLLIWFEHLDIEAIKKKAGVNSSTE
ncbi:Protein tyrosine/serine phosphatase [Candidatus Electrothrix aarhusensis]|uniref:diphosphoinositol-polyphosphate diphosphatase n=1 Tax=Candidatus Electrothrix aarhusensis TaxID=1859131 RepID=A0A444ISQ3_9BACT|nr:Protein tyrosine/serine phosphatase [Candidatus Electrothrix aarhusensis]